MKTREELLTDVSEAARQNLVSRSEVLVAFDDGRDGLRKPLAKRFEISEIMYFVGGAVVFLGFLILVATNWEAFTNAMKVITSMSFAIAVYVLGVIFLTKDDYRTLSNIFLVMAGIFFPVALLVAFDVAGYDFSNSSVWALTGLILLVLFIYSYRYYKHLLFALFVTIFAVWLYYASMGWLTEIFDVSWPDMAFEYMTLVLGISFMFVGRAFTSSVLYRLKPIFYSAGVVGILGSTMALGGYAPNANLFWEFIFPFVVAYLLYLSTQLKRTSILAFTVLFLVAYIAKITSEYFSDVLGWSVAVIVAGFLIIGIGIGFVKFKNRFITKTDDKSTES